MGPRPQETGCPHGLSKAIPPLLDASVVPTLRDPDHRARGGWVPQKGGGWRKRTLHLRGSSPG